MPRPACAVLLLMALAPTTLDARQTPAPPAPDPPAVTLPPAVDRVLRDYESAWRAGDGTRLASLFTDDGFAVQSGSPLARGRNAIARKITGPGGALQLTAYAYALAGDVAYVVGGFRYPQSKGPGGRFVLALRMGPGGRWLIAADLDNSGPAAR